MSTLVEHAEAHIVGGYAGLKEKLNWWGYLQEKPKDAPVDKVQSALAKYQEAYRVELEQGTRKVYGRDLDADGDLGMITARLVNERFCRTSDFANLEEARWPDSCVMDLTVSWDMPAGFPGLSVAQTHEAWTAGLQMWMDLFELRFVIRNENYPNTRLHAKLEQMRGSILAWSMLSTGSCSQRGAQAYSTRRWEMKLVVPTIGHEVGHLLGLQHTPRDPDSLMYPSMNGTQLPNETDIKQMIQLGYKRRTTPIPPPTPPIPPDMKNILTGSVGGDKYVFVGIKTGN